MTSFEQRFAREIPTFERLVSRFGISRALDAGAGTGFHSLLLARLGVEVTAVDVSAVMLAELTRHATEMRLPVTTVQTGFADLPRLVRTTFDAVFCLGNSLPHVSSAEELDSVLGGFASIVRPEGILLLQLVNFERLLASMDRIQSIRETERATYVRFYDYHADRIDFNILTLRRGGVAPGHNLETVRLWPLRARDLSPALAKAGFGRVTSHGGLGFETFDPATSRDLVLVCTRSVP